MSELELKGTRLAPATLGRVTAVLGPPALAPGEVRDVPGGRWAWAGHDRVLALGEVALPPGIAVDQSSGLVALRLTGPLWPDVLARLCPIDPATMHATVRTEVHHVPGQLIAIEGGVEILAPRSYGARVWEDVAHALRAVAAR